MSKTVRVVQPEDVKYLIQDMHYSKAYAKEYLDMLIEKANKYLEQKLQGKQVARNMSIGHLGTVIENLKKCKIV